MLIEKSATTGEVVCLKLANGDELVGRATNDNATHISLSKPMLLILAQHPQTGQPSLQMIPFWMVGPDTTGTYPINKAHIVCQAKANKDVTAGYIQQTSGIITPGGSGLVT